MSSSSSTKRSLEGDENEKSDAKRIKGLDQDNEHEVWKEPRSIVDLELVVHFADDTKIVAHIHRFVMMQHSGWFTTTISALEAGCKVIELEAGTGPFKCALDVTSFVDAMYKGYEQPVDLTGGCGVYAWMNMFDYFECKNHLQALRFRIHRGTVMSTIPMCDRIELARRFKWEELVQSIAGGLDSNDAELLRTNAAAATLLAPAMLNRIVKLEEKLAAATKLMDGTKQAIKDFFDSYEGEVTQEGCAIDDCECRGGHHVPRRDLANNDEFANCPYFALFGLRDSLNVLEL